MIERETAIKAPQGDCFCRFCNVLNTGHSFYARGTPKLLRFHDIS